MTTGYTNSSGENHFVLWVDVFQLGYLLLSTECWYRMVNSVYFVICFDNVIKYILKQRVCFGVAGIDSYFAAGM